MVEYQMYTLVYLVNGGEKVLNDFKVNIFPLRITGDNGHEEHHQYLQKYQ